MYTKCVKKYVTNLLKKSLECYLPGFEGLLLQNDLNLSTCQSQESTSKANVDFQTVLNDFLTEGSFNECFMPCREISYLQTLKYYHSTSFNRLLPDTFDLDIAYSSLDVKTKTETLVYDFGDFLAAVGGNLGLCLGFSCLGCIWQIMDTFQAWLREN